MEKMDIRTRDETLARFPNLSGALVRVLVTEDRSEYWSGCEGCKTTTPEDRTELGTLETARDWARKHSETCRALPQEKDAKTNAQRAKELASRAVQLAAGAGNAVTDWESKHRETAITTHLKAAEVFATLARIEGN